jgi:hypothetical protein
MVIQKSQTTLVVVVALLKKKKKSLAAFWNFRRVYKASENAGIPHKAVALIEEWRSGDEWRNSRHFTMDKVSFFVLKMCFNVIYVVTCNEQFKTNWFPYFNNGINVDCKYCDWTCREFLCCWYSLSSASWWRRPQRPKLSPPWRPE